MVNFVNPGMLGSAAEFKKSFEKPILRGRDADATEAEVQAGQVAMAAMAEIVNRSIIRRTQAILSKYLPVKVEQVLCCRLSPLQEAIYDSFCSSDSVRRELRAEGVFKMTSSRLAAITSLKKLVNHPDLVLRACREGKEGFESSMQHFPAGHDPARLRPELSGKLAVLGSLLAEVRSTTTDKVVLVSNYTQTLDLFELLCSTKEQAPLLSLKVSASTPYKGSLTRVSR